MELQLVSHRSDPHAWRHCRARIEAGAMVEVVLLHDAVLETEATIAAAVGPTDASKLVLMASAQDAGRRQVEERWPLIDYSGIIDRCAIADKVISW